MCSQLRPGQNAPDFKAQAVLPSLEFEDVTLSQFKGKWLVIFSYQEDFSFVAPTEIVEINKKLSEFKKLKTSVLVVSADSVFVHNAWRMVKTTDGGIGDVDLTLVGDIEKSIVEPYGFYNKETNNCYNGTVIINPNGIVMSATYGMPEVGRNIDETLEFIKGCQEVTTTTFSVQAAKTRSLDPKEDPDKVDAQTKCCLLL